MRDCLFEVFVSPGRGIRISTGVFRPDVARVWYLVVGRGFHPFPTFPSRLQRGDHPAHARYALDPFLLLYTQKVGLNRPQKFKNRP